MRYAKSDSLYARLVAVFVNIARYQVSNFEIADVFHAVSIFLENNIEYYAHIELMHF